MLQFATIEVSGKCLELVGGHTLLLNITFFCLYV